MRISSIPRRTDLHDSETHLFPIQPLARVDACVLAVGRAILHGCMDVLPHVLVILPRGGPPRQWMARVPTRMTPCVAGRSLRLIFIASAMLQLDDI